MGGDGEDALDDLPDEEGDQDPSVASFYLANMAYTNARRQHQFHHVRPNVHRLTAFPHDGLRESSHSERKASKITKLGLHLPLIHELPRFSPPLEDLF